MSIEILKSDRLFVLTGAGISAESGIPTFRGQDGLWEGHRLEEVATPQAFTRDPELVWRFYSMRRSVAAGSKPNAGHTALARLEEKLGKRMLICTQNVDLLHEAAGSRRVLHMHGQLFQSRCSNRKCSSRFSIRPCSRQMRSSASWPTRRSNSRIKRRARHRQPHKTPRHIEAQVSPVTLIPDRRQLESLKVPKLRITKQIRSLQHQLGIHPVVQRSNRT
jgi:NAD-dependent SIR2 family protein deacetylase